MIPRPVPRFVLALVALVGLAGASTAHATTVIPVPERALIEDSLAIVIGHVRSIDSHWDPAARQVFTLVTVTVDELLKGEIAATEITLKQAGPAARGRSRSSAGRRWYRSRR